MIGPEAILVTTATDRDPVVKPGVTYGVPFGDFPPGTTEAWMAQGGRDQYSFPSLKSSMGVLIGAIELLREGRVAEAIRCVEEASTTSYQDMYPQEKWDFWAEQMPTYGPLEPEKRKDMQRLLTERASGVVLEAMCGFTSYIDDDPRISQVIAMDFSREALERYDHPERQRVLFDLNSIDATEPGAGISILPDESVDTVCITFGINYLERPLDVYHELHRILSAKGKLLIVGGTMSGFEDLITYDFNPYQTAPVLGVANFETEITQLPFFSPGSLNEYYLIEATKI